MRYWLNIDRPTRFAKLHRESCRFCKPQDQFYKGVNSLKDNGGWFMFNAQEEAYAFYLENFSRFYWKQCRICLKSTE